MKAFSILAILLVCLQGCSQPAKHEIVPESLDEVYALAESSDNIRSLIISLGNEVVAERYYDKYSSDSLDHLRSATKSIMTMLISIAVDKGMISSIEDPIVRYLDNVPEDKEDIKVVHLMNMKSGITWDEGIGYNDNNRMVDSGNPYKHMMELPMASKPGTNWEYSTGDIHLLSVILSEASGMSTLDFANTHFFGPLGIKNLKWQKFGDGYYSGGSRLQLKPRDMLKIGQMCANGGVYGGQRILSSTSLQTATDVKHLFNSTDGVDEGYGYGWWTINVHGTKAFMASGYGGQSIVVIPDHELVVVMTHNWRVSGEKAGDQQNEAQKIAVAIWQWVKGEKLLPNH